MAHELCIINGKASMAYVGETPWHGLGQQLTAESTREEWLEESGMNFGIMAKPVLFYVPESEIVVPFPNRIALYRNDNNHPLSIVSDKFRVVQPKQIMEQQFNICDALGATMETAGVLFDGRRFWSLSRFNDDTIDLNGDRLTGYVLIATACDGTMATTIRRTWVRVVCNNTLTMAIGGGKCEIRIPHQIEIEFSKVRVALGIDDDAILPNIEATLKSMTEYRLDEEAALGYIVSVLHGVSVDTEEALEESDEGISTDPSVNPTLKLKGSKVVKDIYTLWDGAGRGSSMDTANGTLWGVLNAITEYQDHHRLSKSTDHQLNRMWFGDGENIKNRAYQLACNMVGA